MKKILWVLVLILMIYSVDAATYYVSSSTGNDNNPGTIAQPWQTLNKVNTMAFNPGDTILFKRNDIWNGELRPSTAGTAVNFISYSAYSTGTNPIIHATSNYALNGNKNYIRYSDLILENAINAGFVTYSNNQELNNIVSRNNNGNGYLVRGNNNVFTNSRAENNQQYGFLGDDNGGTPSIGYTLNNFVATYNKEEGIQFRIANNIVVNNGESSYNGEYPIIEGNGLSFTIVNTATINNFHSHHNWGNGLLVIDGSSNVNILGGEYNHNIRGFIDYPASCIRLDTNTANSRVMYVKSHDCESAGFVLEDGANNNLIAYNLFYKNARGGSFSSVPGLNNKIYNNVFYNNVGSDSGGLAIRSSVPVTVKNNIFLSNNKGMFFDQGGNILTHTMDYNLYFGNTIDIRYGSTSYSSNQVQNGQYYQATGYEQHGVGLNPYFVNPSSSDFHLQSNSNAIDKGTNVGLIRDFDGISVPQGSAVDIGAFEFIQTTPQQCSDGTLYGQCSVNQPLFCNNGQLVNNCQQCGCPQGLSCQSDGSCRAANQPPIATITQPTQTTFVVNTPINYAGTGSDPEDGSLPGSSLCWSYDITGDSLGYINLGCGSGGTFTPGTLVNNLPTIYTLKLVTTDSQGLSTSTTRDLTINPETPTQCSDSDGGLNYQIKGTTNDGILSSTDRCSDRYVLIEYYCLNNRVNSVSKDCRDFNVRCKRSRCGSRSFFSNIGNLFRSSGSESQVESNFITMVILLILLIALLFLANNVMNKRVKKRKLR